MQVNPSEIVTLLSPMQPENAYTAMFVTLFGIVTSPSLAQSANASAPMSDTLLGIATLARLRQPANELCGMFVIVDE